MSRDIKFRAWSITHKTMLDMYINFKFLNGGKLTYTGKDEVEIDEYTGFEDVNGISIYENDVIRDTDDGTIIGSVLKRDGSWVVGNNLLVDVTEHEVIGSTHRSPEYWKQ